MGMAASQARFLNLTARKTNLEYQGQQINQQRTELSNQSATLYNQMLSLQVPTPPNTQDYTKVSYTFMMPGGNDEATISQFVALTGSNAGKYTVAFSYKTVELGMAPCTDNEKPVLRYTSSGVYDITTSSGKGYTLTKYNTSSSDADIHKDACETLAAKLTTSTGTTVNATDIYYVNVGTDSAPKYQYYNSKDFPTTVGNTEVVTYYTASDIETYKQDRYTPCTINRDVQNRVQSFTYTPTGGTSTTFAVTTNTITDEDAYNDAMNEYTYKSYLYEQAMANINAKTSVIQIQDRELELKLKQLDTEHNAIQTETDSVQSVCKKNVEDSFKVFA
ncbi:hypothetical protein IJ818_00090 [bacterium]|nr:hypothetical protein [bacterium]